MADFQNQVAVSQAPAVAGDFASTNPRASYVAGPGGLVSGPLGVVVARFAWAVAPLDGDGTPATVYNSGFGLPSGFVHREQQASITTYLAASGNTILPGQAMTLMISGDYWVTNSGATEAEFGQKAYVNFADGTVNFAATGTPANGGTSTASTLAAGTASVTGSITGNLLTVTAVGSGTLYAGGNLSGTGVAANTAIVNQITPLLAGETTGGVGRYALNVGEQTVASTTISETYGLLTVGGTVAGTFAVGQAVTGSGVTAGMSITALGTGSGGAGTYITNISQVLSSQAINTASNIETKYYARSTGLTGEIVKISNTPTA